MLWEIAARRIPYDHVKDDGIIREEVRKGEREEIPLDCARHFARLIPQAWAHDAKKRLSAEDIVAQLQLELPTLQVVDLAPWDFDHVGIVDMHPKEVIYT